MHPKGSKACRCKSCPCKYHFKPSACRGKTRMKQSKKLTKGQRTQADNIGKKLLIGSGMLATGLAAGLTPGIVKGYRDAQRSKKWDRKQTLKTKKDSGGLTEAEQKTFDDLVAQGFTK